MVFANDKCVLEIVYSGFHHLKDVDGSISR